MPTVQDTPIEGYAHCLNARCAGYSQEKVDATRRETFFTFADLGGDGNMPGYERSTVQYLFADEDQAVCSHCAGNREVTPTPRTTYEASGHDPMGLLAIRPGGAPDVAALQAEVEALRERVGDAA